MVRVVEPVVLENRHGGCIGDAYPVRLRVIDGNDDLVQLLNMSVEVEVVRASTVGRQFTLRPPPQTFVKRRIIS